MILYKVSNKIKCMILQTTEFINQLLTKQLIHRYLQISTPTNQGLYMART